MLNKITKTNLIAIMLLVAWGGYCLAVLLKTGFISDDAYESQIRGRLIQDNITVFTRTSDEVLGWITGAGRFTPLGLYYRYMLYNLTQNSVLIKLITLIIVLIGVILFYKFVKNETNSRYVGLLAGLTIPVFFQFRLWHDPILAFTALTPIVFAYMMGALVLFQKYLDNKKKYLLYLAVFFYLLSLLTYEIAYPFGILFTLLAYSHNKDFKQSIKISWLFIFLSVFFVALTIFLKMYLIPKNVNNYSPSYAGAHFHTDLGKVVQAFKVQSFSSLPLSYFFANKGLPPLLFYKTDLIAIGAFYIATCFSIIKLAKEKVIANLGTLVTIGILMVFFPALEIALSGHQNELIQIGYGFGYIPVYFQYFGLCLVSIVALIHICNNLSVKFVVIFALIISALLSTIATINLGLNRAVALETNKFYKYPRQLLESALRAGIAADLKENALILRTMRFPSDFTWFYTTVTGKKFNICNINEITAPRVRRIPSDWSYVTGGKKYNICNFDAEIAAYKKNVYGISAVQEGDEIIKQNSTEILDTSSLDIWILSYTFDKEWGEKGQLFLGRVDHIIQDVSSGVPIQIVVKKLRIYQLEENKIYSVDLEAHPINFLKIVGNEDGRPSSFKNFSPDNLLAEDADFLWLGEVHGRDGSDKSNVRWSSGSGKLVLYNFSGKPQTIKFSMRLGVPGEESSHLFIKYPEYVETLNLDQKQIPYSKILSLPPGETVITFTSDGKPIANGDPRKIVFGIFDFEFTRIQEND